MHYQLMTCFLACQYEETFPIEGVEGIGSGLCYHYSLSIPGLLVLTDAATGKYLPGAHAVTEEQAQELLERLAPYVHSWKIGKTSDSLLQQQIARTMRSLDLFVIYI